MKWICYFVGALMLVACGNTNMETNQALPLEGEYQIISVDTDVLNDTDYVLTFDLEEQKAYGYVGCNRFSSSFVQEGNNLQFKGGLSTKMFCEGKMEIEARILDALEEITGVRKANDKLVLHSSESDDLITIKKQEKRE